MVVNGNNLQDEDLKRALVVGDYFIYYNTYMSVSDKYWTLYQFEGFTDGPSVPDHFLMCRCLGSSSAHKDKVNVVSGKVYKLSIKDARVGYKAHLLRNHHLLIKRVFLGIQSGKNN